MNEFLNYQRNAYDFAVRFPLKLYAVVVLKMAFALSLIGQLDSIFPKSTDFLFINFSPLHDVCKNEHFWCEAI